MPYKRLYITPNAYLKNTLSVTQRLEKNRFPLPDVDLEKEITFFNNEKATECETQYDQYFKFTKTFPLYDQRKLKSNRKYPPDVWKNIYEQEKYKAVPATTSLNYGRRPFYDMKLGDHGRVMQIPSFFRRQGNVIGIHVEKFSEDDMNANFQI